MRITQIEIFPVPLILRESYTIAYHTVSSVTNVAMILHTNDHITCAGISGPEEEVTGETFKTVLKAAKEIIEPYLLGRDISDIYETLSELDTLLGTKRAALTLVDTALYDYAAKKAKLPLHKFLGAKRDLLPTSITVNIHSPEETLRRSKKMLAEGYSILKIKGGLDLDEDLVKLKLLRAELGFSTPIIFDINQGYSCEQFEQFLLHANQFSLLCIEQPIPKDNKQYLCDKARSFNTPIMVDESLVTHHDAEMFGQAGIQYFNIKLMKCGGIYPAQKLDTIATKYKTKVITSCMDEAALANAFGLAFSLASPNVDFVDLDSFTDYKLDPTRKTIEMINGQLRIADIDFAKVF